MSDNQEQHVIEASHPQGFSLKDSDPPAADNPLQPPKPQRLPTGGAMEERGETKEESQNMEQASKQDSKTCCCFPSLRSVLMDSTDHCCCFELCAVMFICCIFCIVDCERN